jgi:hypothetical protein
MLDYSELTVYKNTDGIATALGFPVNSLLLQNNKPLFVGGGKGINDSMAVPAGLVCMTETICTRANGIGANAKGMAPNANAYAYEDEDAYEDAYANADVIDENEIVPDGLYERLMELAETKPMKKMTKRKQLRKHKKTHKHKK